MTPLEDHRESTLTEIATTYDVPLGDLLRILPLWQKHHLTPVFGEWTMYTLYGDECETPLLIAACALTVQLVDAGVPAAQLHAAENWWQPSDNHPLTYSSLAHDALNLAYDEVRQLALGFDRDLAFVDDCNQPPAYRLGYALRQAVEAGLHLEEHAHVSSRHDRR